MATTNSPNVYHEKCALLKSTSAKKVCNKKKKIVFCITSLTRNLAKEYLKLGILD